MRERGRGGKNTRVSLEAGAVDAVRRGVACRETNALEVVNCEKMASFSPAAAAARAMDTTAHSFAHGTGGGGGRGEGAPAAKTAGENPTRKGVGGG